MNRVLLIGLMLINTAFSQSLLHFKDSYNMHFINSYRFAQQISFIQYGMYDEASFDAKIADGYIPIASELELNAIRTTQSYLMGVGTKYKGEYTVGVNKKYVVYNPIDLISYSFVPIPTFSGIFDGNEVLIDNLTVNSELAGVGLFFANTGTCKNMILENAFVHKLNGSANTSAGGLCGSNYGTIDNCSFSGTVETTPNIAVGGLCGINLGTITNSMTIGIVSGISYVGGLVGNNSSAGIITYSNSQAAVSGTIERVGSFVGQNDNLIEKCYAIGNAYNYGTGNGFSTGGFVGMNQKIINNCWSSGNAETTKSYVGGFVGLNFTVNAVITNSYSLGSAIGVSNVGGFCSLNQGNISNSYWDTVASGNATSVGGTGKTTTEMKEGLIPDTTIFIDWDNTIWNAGTLTEYPYLN